MVYQFFKQLVGFSLSIYYKKIQFIDKHNLPKKGPVIIVANHPSAVLDPITIATKINGELSYIAAAEWFGKGIKNKIFRNQFNMIPVYRPWIEKSKKESNQNMFEDCTKSLQKNSRIIIFPEGTSVTSNYIRELKTGTARMKLDYEGHPESKEPLIIIPIGVNYSNAHKFYSSVTIKVGKPIEFDKVNTEGTSQDELQEIAKTWTNQIHKGMESTIVNIKPGKNADIINLSINLLNSQDFGINQKLALNIAAKKEQESFINYRDRLLEYTNSMRKLGLPLHHSASNSAIKHFIIILLLSPLYIIFAVTYGLPLLLAKLIFNQVLDAKIDTEYESKKLNPSFRGSLVFLSGMAVMLLWMITAYLFVGLVFKLWLWGLPIFILAYPIIKLGLYTHYKTNDFFNLIQLNRIRNNDLAGTESLIKNKLDLMTYIKNELIN